MLPLKTAMLLSAGLGTRLRPLTNNCPKPLIKAGGKALIDWHLEKLRAIGIERVIINVAYLHEQIIAHVGDGTRYDLDVVYSIEGDAPLGVMQGVQKAKHLLGDGVFLLVSADTWYEADLLRGCMAAESDAHFVLVENIPPHAGDFAVNNVGELSETGDKKTYSGIARLCVDDLPEAPAGFADFIRGLMQEKKVSANVYRGDYFNVGTPEILAQLNDYLQSQ